MASFSINLTNKETRQSAQALEKLGNIYKNIDNLENQCRSRASRRFKSTQKLRPIKQEEQELKPNIIPWSKRDKPQTVLFDSTNTCPATL